MTRRLMGGLGPPADSAAPGDSIGRFPPGAIGPSPSDSG